MNAVKSLLEKDPVRAVEVFERALRFARQQLGPDVTVLRLQILLNAHLNPASSQRELAALSGGISATALSRNLADLSAWSSRKQEGLGLVELRADPMNLRVKRIYLTARGKRFVRQLMGIFQDAARHTDRSGGSND
jgi:DNA-binding MarR family transcriptional regulator